MAVAYAAPAFASSTWVDPVNSCWQNTSGILDLRYGGPINKIANAIFTDSQNGTCSGNAMLFPTVVRASTFVEANATCMTLLNKPASGSLNGIGYPGAPADFWLCDAPPL